MSYRVLLTNKRRIASAAVASVMLATFIFPSAYVLADTDSTDSATPNTSASAPASTPAAAPLINPTTADATATTGIAVTDHSTTVSAADVATTLAHNGCVLAASDQTKTTSDGNSAIQAVTAGASVDVPKDPSDGVSLGAQNGPKLDIQLPNADKAQDAKQVALGTVAYPSSDGSASAVQATEDGGVRMLTIIDNPSAPTVYDYQVTVPDGGRVELTSDGGAIIVDGNSNVMASVAKPWAHDATGKEINTYFTTDGTNLVQHIEHNVPGVVYPVTADPSISWGWFAVYITLSASDQHDIVTGGSAVAAAVVCTYFTDTVAIRYCVGIGALVATLVANHYNPRHSVQLKFSWFGRIEGIRTL